jgi:hypothetical protein
MIYEISMISSDHPVNLKNLVILSKEFNQWKN